MVAAASILETPPSIFSRAATDDAAATWLERWSRHGWLSLEPVADTTRSLGDWLAGCVEHELARLGAATRPAYVATTPSAILEDQLYRLRMLGFPGLAVLLPSLSPWSEQGVLCSRNSAALVAWCDAARGLQVPVRLCTSDDSLQLYEAPVQLTATRLLAFPIASEPELPAPVAQASEAPSAINEVQEPLEAHRESGIEQLLPPPPSAVSSVSRRAAMKSLLADDDDVDDAPLAPMGATLTGDLRAASDRFAARRLVLPEAAPAPMLADQDDDAPESPAPDSVSHRSAVLDNLRPVAAPSDPVAPATDSNAIDYDSDDAPSEPQVEPELEPQHDHEVEQAAFSAATVVPTRPELLVQTSPLSFDDDSYSQHVEGLQAAGGSHGWEDIEALFEAHYLPLQKAVRDGAAPALAASVLAEWAKDFAESYEQAFEAIRQNRGKKPRLVLDVPSYAFALSRKHNAENLKLVLVDALRADVGAIVRDKLRVQMMGTAECVANGTLWSALPCNTAAQMELIARGSDGLRHFSGELTEAQLMSRGNDLRRLRPVRVGSHRMYKLDIVQYLARDADKHSSDNLEQYAAEVATSVGRFLRQQEPGTLVYLFGDHGFGGSSDTAPEQVLTPYQAWQIAR